MRLNRIIPYDPPLYINDERINTINCLNFLGVKIDCYLRFSEHIQFICSRMSKTSGMLYRASQSIPFDILLNIYYSLVHPYLMYGILTWGSASQVYLNWLIVIQKRIIRTTTSSEYRAHTRPLLFKCKILRVDDLNKYAVGIFMFKNYRYEAIDYPHHIYYARSRNTASVSYQRLTQCQKSLSYTGPKIWSSSPISRLIGVFKKNYRLHLLNIYGVT